MDKSLLILLVLSMVLVSLLAPYAMLTITAIISLVSLFIWGSWSFLQGFGQSTPAPQRVWD